MSCPAVVGIGSRRATSAVPLPFIIRRLTTSRRGGTAIEYALVAALVSISIVSSPITLGQWIPNVPDAAGNAMS